MDRPAQSWRRRMQNPALGSFAVVLRGHAHHAFEFADEMGLIEETGILSKVAERGHHGMFQSVPGTFHAQVAQQLFGREPHMLAEDPFQVASGNTELAGSSLHG